MVIPRTVSVLPEKFCTMSEEHGRQPIRHILGVGLLFLAMAGYTGDLFLSTT